MDSFDSTRGYDSSHGHSIGYSTIYSECVSRSDSFCEAIAPPLYPGEPAAIARGIFTTEVRDVLVVLRNCGVLRTKAECLWCIRELGRLLLELFPGHVV